MKRIGRAKHNRLGKEEFSSVYGGGTPLAGVPLSSGASKPFGRGAFGSTGPLKSKPMPPSRPRVNRPHM